MKCKWKELEGRTWVFNRPRTKEGWIYPCVTEILIIEPLDSFKIHFSSNYLDIYLYNEHKIIWFYKNKR